MPTLLISRTCQPEANELAKIAAAAGWNHQWLGRRKVPLHLHGTEFGLLAEVDVALNLCRWHDLTLIEPSFDLLSRMPDRFVSRQIEFMTLGEALRIPDRRFIKPADCANKAFDAAVWEAGKYIYCSDDLSRETPVLVSDPVDWYVEYHVIVMEREVVTLSPYIRAGWLARTEDGRWPYNRREAEEMIAFCRDLLRDETVDLPPAFVLDVGRFSDDRWAVIEFNPIWCSGLLGCQLEAILPVLRRACLSKDEISTKDGQWVIERAKP